MEVVRECPSPRSLDGKHKFIIGGRQYDTCAYCRKPLEEYKREAKLKMVHSTPVAAGRPQSASQFESPGHHVPDGGGVENIVSLLPPSSAPTAPPSGSSSVTTGAPSSSAAVKEPGDDGQHAPASDEHAAPAPDDAATTTGAAPIGDAPTPPTTPPEHQPGHPRSDIWKEHERIKKLIPEIIKDFPIMGDEATREKHQIKISSWKRLKTKLNLHEGKGKTLSKSLLKKSGNSSIVRKERKPGRPAPMMNLFLDSRCRYFSLTFQLDGDSTLTLVYTGKPLSELPAKDREFITSLLTSASTPVRKYKKVKGEDTNGGTK